MEHLWLWPTIPDALSISFIKAHLTGHGTNYGGVKAIYYIVQTVNKKSALS